MNDNTVVFKGTKEGLYIIIKEDLEFEDIKKNLDKKIKPSKKFFEGAKIVNFRGKRLSRIEFDELKEAILQDYGMEVTGEYRDIETEASIDREETKELRNYETLHYDCVIKGEALVVRATIRSGQRIECDGSIVIIGDVNPGAFLRCTGSIIVMGAMRGTAHAGSEGDYGAFVAAFSLSPTQLRIGDIITRSPDGANTRNSIPEMALVKQGMIVVEPYLPNK